LVVNLVQAKELFFRRNDLTTDLHNLIDVLGGVEAVHLRLIRFAFSRAPVQRVVNVEREVPFAALEARADLDAAPRAPGGKVFALVGACVWRSPVRMLNALAAPVVALNLCVVGRFGGRAGGVAVLFILDRTRSFATVARPRPGTVNLTVRSRTIFAGRAPRNVACFANRGTSRVVAPVGLRGGLASTVTLFFSQRATAVVAHLALGVLFVSQVAAVVIAVSLVERPFAYPTKWLAGGVETSASSSGRLVIVLHGLRAPAAQIGRGVSASRAVLVDVARVVDGGRCEFQCRGVPVGHSRRKVALE